MSELVLEKNKIPQGWTETSFDSIAEIKNGFAFKSFSYQKSGIPLVRISNIQDRGINLETNCVYLSEKFLDSPKKFKIIYDDILIALSGATTGKFGIFKNDVNALLNQRVGLIRSRNKKVISQKFLFYYFGTLQKLILKKAYGMAQPNISTNFLKELLILVPPLNEQKRMITKIEELFSNLVDCEELLEKIESQLKIYKFATLFSAFKGQLTFDWRKKNSDKLMSKNSLIAKMKELNQNKKRKKESSEVKIIIDSLPEEWILASLGDLIYVTMGQSPPGSSYNSEQNGLPLLNGPTEFGDVYPVPTQWTTQPTKTCSKNNLLFCVRGNTAGRMNWSDREYCIGRGLASLRPLNGFFNSKLLYYFLLIKQKEILLSGKGTTFPNISKDRLENYSIPVMSPKEQDELEKILDFHFTMVNNLSTSVKKYHKFCNQLKIVIIKSAFEGKLVPQDPNDEPAKILLQKIKKEKEQLEQKVTPRRKKNVK